MEQLRASKSPLAMARYQSHSTLLTMPRLNVTLPCFERPGSFQVWVLRPPSAYSCTSTSDCRPVQSLKPPGGKSSNVTVKRNAGTGSKRLPVLGILCSLFLDVDPAARDADAHDHELRRVRRLDAHLAGDAAVVGCGGRVRGFVAADEIGILRRRAVEHAGAVQALQESAHRAVDLAPQT